jgi:hypothetical protein
VGKIALTTQPHLAVPKHISTSYAERANLTMRMHMRRFTRLANGFSKKIENHTHQAALHFHVLQFRPHPSDVADDARVAAGVSDRLWEIGDIVSLVEANDPKPVRRGSYKKTEISK